APLDDLELMVYALDKATGLAGNEGVGYAVTPGRKGGEQAVELQLYLSDDFHILNYSPSVRSCQSKLVARRFLPPVNGVGFRAKVTVN
ncbi:MAG: hypothetical protein MI924_03380, partial [Chloroflexales bacterium]|nr:hypothetical protein [Chloroflexales bacterium]